MKGDWTRRFQLEMIIRQHEWGYYKEAEKRLLALIDNNRQYIESGKK